VTVRVARSFFLLMAGAAALAGVPAIAADLAAALRNLGDPRPAIVSQAIVDLAALDDPAALPTLRAFQEGKLRIDAAGSLLVPGEDDTFVDAATGTPITPSGELRTPIVNNRVRRELKPTIAQLELHSADPAVRVAAAGVLMKHLRPEALGPMKGALARETDSWVKSRLAVGIAELELHSPDESSRLAAIAMIRESGDLALRTDLQALLEPGTDGTPAETSEKVRDAARATITSLDRKQLFVSSAANVFYGISLGSVLLLAALGLGITFGLMGVINMAHGEMIMLGAYATYSIQRAFLAYAPGAADWAIAVAIPAAFAVCTIAGMILERAVIQFLYGRPLETLLATWGASLIIIQTVRFFYGAQNVQVSNPTWLSGGVEVMHGVVLPYSRIAIVIFVALIVGALAATLRRSTVGLEVRAVTQNRAMAASLGIATRRVDLWTFGLGSGLAGLGGVALSQLGNVGPELGQQYIVDCFMVVVIGGVGNVAGTVFAALGLGMVNKLLEPLLGAVLGKITVLVFIVLFIQRRPQGLFALKGRAVEG
jgi:urea transport system permease protein